MAILPYPSPSGMTLLVLHGSTQHEPLQGYFPHLLRQNYSPSMCPQHHPTGSPTAFNVGEGNIAVFEGFKGTS